MDAWLTSTRRPNRLVAPLAGLPVLLLLAACGSTAAPTASPDPSQSPTVTVAATGSPAATATAGATATSPFASIPDPCVLVTKAEAEAAVGAALNDGLSELFSRPDDTSGRSCFYDAASGPGRLNLNVWQATAEQFASYKEEEKQFGDIHDIGGLGDAAFRTGWIGLVVLKDGYVLDYGIEMVDYDPEIAQQRLQALAATSIGRL